MQNPGNETLTPDEGAYAALILDEVSKQMAFAAHNPKMDASFQANRHLVRASVLIRKAATELRNDVKAAREARQ